MTQQPDQPGRRMSSRAPSAADAVFRRALRDMLTLLAALTALGTSVGAIVAGQPGIWGAVIGVGLALLFSGTTIVSMLVTTRASLQAFAAVVLGAWLGKVIVVIVVLTLIQDRHFYDKTVFAVVVLVGALGSAFLDYRAVTHGRVPYVEPGAQQADVRPGPEAS